MTMDFLQHYGDDDDDAEDEDSNSHVARSSMTMNDSRHTADRVVVTRKRRKPSKELTEDHDSSSNNGDFTCGVTSKRRIPIVTETEYSRLMKKRNDSVQPQPGRWSTHCSCTISLNRDEIKRAHEYVRWLCRTIQQCCPTYSGHAILLFHDQPFPRKQKKCKTLVGPRTTTVSQSSLLQHVSLTRPDVALHHTQQIESFVKSLSIELQQQQPPFYLTLGPTPHHHPPDDHQSRHGTTKFLKQHILHDSTKTKSFGIWHCHGPAAVTSLQRLSDACNRVLCQHYQQGSYHYHHHENDTEEGEGSPHHHPHGGDPIYHVSLVRFEPCLYECLTIMSRHAGGDTVTATTRVDHPDDDHDETSRANGEWNDDDDDDDDDDESTNHYHYVDHVTCQFGGGAKVYQIPFST